ncbi:hypothetical protein DKX38_000314 [Salix brachista]|uniref:DUF4283 domain-containing protein n=1 Tax=Salix brachista TaxID=2182728 RepID=A0A5N5P079_9ROSI|nr:hypothetical protein DKX38_000314 [Salix brachista]
MAAHNKDHAKPGTTPPITWADRVRVTNSATRHTLEALPQKQAGTRLVIPATMKMHDMGQWSRCMVGFFTGYKPPFQAINLIARKAWGPYGLQQVQTVDDGFLIFRFEKEEAVLEVIEKGPWMIGGKNIILQKWSPKFQFDRSSISTIPVWVRLKGLPLPLWTKEGLSMAASMLGRPLSCDEHTINCRRLDYARLCVELDARLLFVHRFEVESPLTEEPQVVRVEYEWKPPRCLKCNSFGHNCKPHKQPQGVEDENVAAEVPKEKEGHARETTKNKGKDILVIQENQLTQPPHNKSSSNSAKEPKQPAKESTKEGGKTNKVASQLSESKGETLKRNGKEPLVQLPLQGEDNIEVDEGEEGEEVSSSQQNRPSTSGEESFSQVMTMRKKKGGRKKGREAKGL